MKWLLAAWNFLGSLASMLALLLTIKILREERKIEKDVDEVMHPDHKK